MVCPICGDTELGSWLYRDDSAPSLSDSSSDDDDWTSVEDPYGSDFAEDPSVLPWCPSRVMEGVRSSYERVESPSYPSTLTATRFDGNATSRSGPYNLPFRYNDISFTSGRSLFVSSPIHHGNITLPHQGSQASHVGHPSQGYPTSLISPNMPAVERFSGPGGMPVLTPAPRHGAFNNLPLSHVGHPSQGYPTSLISPNMPVVRRFSGPMDMPVLTPAPHHGAFNNFPRSEVQNLHEENRDHLSSFPVMSSNRSRVWELHQQASGSSDSSSSYATFGHNGRWSSFLVASLLSASYSD